MADYTKFKAYWESIGKPPVEYTDDLHYDFRVLNSPSFDDDHG